MEMCMLLKIDLFKVNVLCQLLQKHHNNHFQH